MPKKSISKMNDTIEGVNISPLIDMVFILLIFFIVTSVFIEEKGLAAQTPVPDQRPRNEEKQLSLLIKKTGQVIAQYGGEETDIGLNGVLGRVRQEMNNSKYPILVNVHPSASINLYVQVHDICILAGAETITIKVIEE